MLNWPLRSRMLLLVLVPLVAIVPLAGVRVVGELKTIDTASDIHDQTLIAQRISGLVNALGDERDQTERALSKKGFHGNDDLARAKKTTSARARALRATMRKYHGSVQALPPETRQLGARARARLGDLEPVRSSAERLGAGTPTFTAYSTIVEDLLQFDGQLAASTPDHPLSTLVNSLAQVHQVQEQTSIQRGHLVQVLGSGHATLEQTEQLEQAQAQVNSAYEAITGNAPTSIVNLYQSKVSGNRVGAADGTVEAVTTSAQEGRSPDDAGVGQDESFRDMSSKLSAVRSVQARVNADMTDRASELLSEGRTGLYLNVGIIVVVIVASLFGAVVLARSIVRPLRTLRTSALDVADSRLPDVVRRLRDAKSPEEIARTEPIGVHTTDEVGQVARAFDRVHSEAVRLATEQAMMRDNVNTMFTNLSRRSESLVLRQLNLIDELEDGEQSPTQLASLFKLDHLATRMRRNNESLLVLAGEEQGRRWARPVLLVDVARAAAAEVEEYERVSVQDMPDVAVAGQVATDIVHLVAELIENATAFSAPETEVHVSAKALATGEVMLDVTDAGIGMRPEELREINEKLAEPPVVDVSISRRMGLFVVGRLASKHEIRVWLSKVPTGGLTAVSVLPLSLLREPSETDSETGAAFDQARRSGQDSLDISDLLGSGFSSETIAPDERRPAPPGAPRQEPQVSRSEPQQPWQPQGGGPAGPPRPAPRTPGEPGPGQGPVPRPGPVPGPGSVPGPVPGQGSVPGSAPMPGGPDPRPRTAGSPPPAPGPASGQVASQGAQGAQPSLPPLPRREPDRREPEPSHGQAYEQPGGGRESGVPDGGFGWFSDTADTADPADPAGLGTDPHAAAQPAPQDAFPADDFGWFTDTGESAGFPEPSAPTGPPAQAGPAGSAGHAGAAAAGGGPGDRLPIFDAIESEWFGPETPGGAPSAPAPASAPPPQPALDETTRLRAVPAEGQPPRPGSGAPPRPPPAPAAPPRQDGPPAASRPASGGVTAHGLPKRVPRSNLLPGSAVSQRPPVTDPAPVPPRSAEQLKDRLSRFHQGVRNGKSGTDRADDGARPYGTDAP